MRSFRHFFHILVLPFSLAAAFTAFGQMPGIREAYRPGDFKLASAGRSAPIAFDPLDNTVVRIAANDLAADIERVTGTRSKILDQVDNIPGDVVIVGTLGKSRLIDRMTDAGKIDVAAIKGKWESFVIETVQDPLPNVGSALVIAGSDRRGTAFGIYHLSQMIGVSPWYWWADVAPEHRSSLFLSSGKVIAREPSVRYRGIFINDEDWGLQPWAAKTFEPETGNIGPKTYAKVFELLLRLKANTLWPAMHEVTTPFNSDPRNSKLADDYAIVMGSSHAEPMLRNNVGEWKANKDDYNFLTNPSGVTEYWRKRVEENGKYENIYTLGMRGIHDSSMQGPKTQVERIPLLEEIFGVQRSLLAKYVRSDVEKIPQIFCPYKEVLSDYRASLKVPDDVTIVFPDDNFGYIRQFPNDLERSRRGGFGVYYHISYLGRPISYFWLNSVPPALIWEEMSKAYANGMDRLWIVNVGDIKPGEIGTEFFLQMAYDAKKWNVGNIGGFLSEWAKREFGASNAAPIARIMESYFRLGFQRKPEHLQWFLPGEPARKSSLNDDEISSRLRSYSTQRERAEQIANLIPPNKRNAFYELVLYPVRSAALANERFFAAELAEHYKASDPARAREWAKRSVDADSAITSDAKYFNNELAEGKWRNIMSPDITSGQWPSLRSNPPKLKLADFGSDVKTSDEITGRSAVQRSAVSSPAKHVKRSSEIDGVVSIEAERFSRATETNGVTWKIILGLGRTGDSVTTIPRKATTFAPPAAPTLEYRVRIETSAEFSMNFTLLPTQPLLAGNKTRLAYSFDNGPPVVIDATNPEVGGKEWSYNVLNESNSLSSQSYLTKGDHVLTVFAVDTGIVLDKIVLNSRPLNESYFGPPETGAESLKTKRVQILPN
ncbi:MAG: glycosyl hydrolase 115 family protein [Acidobacteriota bacterium]